MDRTDAPVASQRPAAKPRVALSATWAQPSLAEPDDFWASQHAAALHYDASASASFQPSPAPTTSLSLTAPIIQSIKFPTSYLHVDTDSGAQQGSTTYTLSDIAPSLAIITTSSEGDESGRSSGGPGNRYASSSSSMAAAADVARLSAALCVPCASPLSSSSSLSLPSPPMSPTSSDYTRALRELEELAREEDWMTSASEYESDAEVRRGRERSRSGEKERSDRLLAPRNYIASSIFNHGQSPATPPAAPAEPAAPAAPVVVAVKAVLSASTSAMSTSSAASVLSASSSQPSASLPPLPPSKGSAVAFTIQKKLLSSAPSPHSSSPHSLSPSVPASATLAANASSAAAASGSSPSHTRSLSRQMRRRTAEPGTLLSRPSSRPESRAGSRANSPPRMHTPQNLSPTTSAASLAGEADDAAPQLSMRPSKRGSASRRRTWNHSALTGQLASQDDSTITFDLKSTSRRSSVTRTESTVTASPSSYSAAPSAATSPRSSVISTSRQAAQTDSDSLKQRRARRQLSHSWMNSPASSVDTDDAGFDSAPPVPARRRSRSQSPDWRSRLNDSHAIASTSSASSSSSAVEPMHRRQQSTPPASASCPVLPPMAAFNGDDTRASSLPSPLIPSGIGIPLPSPPLLTSFASPATSLQAQGDKVALVLEGRQIALLSLAAVQQLLDGQRGKDEAAERDGRGSRTSGRRRSAKFAEEADEAGAAGRRSEVVTDESEDEDDRAARLRLQSQRRRSQKRLSVRTSNKFDPAAMAALHRREQSIDN